MTIPVVLGSGFVPTSFSFHSLDDQEHTHHMDPHKQSIMDELTVLLKELRAAIYNEEPHNIVSAYRGMLSTLNWNLGLFNVDETIHYIQTSVDLLGDRVLEAEFQNIFVHYLLTFTKIYTKIVMSPVKEGVPHAVLDLYFLNKMKEIYTPYILGEYFHEWKENCMSTIVEMGKGFRCTTYELIEFVSNFTMVDVLFSNGPMEMGAFRDKLVEKSKENSFEFLKRLFAFEISLPLFSEVMQEAASGELTDEQIEIIGKYLEWDRIALGKAVELLKAVEEKCLIIPSAWNRLLGSLFTRINQSKKLLFFDIWKTMQFYFFISKRYELDKEIVSQFYKVFECNIKIVLADKNSLSRLRYGVEEQKKLVEDLIEGLLLWYHLETESQKKTLVNILLGIAYMHSAVLRLEHSFKFLEKIAAKIQSCNETDYFLLMFILDLISQCKGENPKGQMMLIINLANLSLFKNSDLTFLLRNWNYFSEDFQVLHQDDYFLVEVLSLLFGISERELVLHLFVQPQEIANFQKIKSRMVHKINFRDEPTARELILIKRYCIDPDLSVDSRIDIFQYLLGLYKLPPVIEELNIKKILMSFIKTKTAEKRAKTGKHEALKTNDIEYDLHRKILQLLANGYFVLDKKNFGKDYSKLLTHFLLHPFKLDAIIDINIIDNDLEVSVRFQEFRIMMEKILDLYGIRSNYLESCIYLNWMNACLNSYKTLRKGAYDSMKEVNKEEMIDMFLKLKQSLHQLFIEAFNALNQINPRAETLISSYVRALNRPLLNKILPRECILVIEKK